ncbi:hypothetical protein G9A89_008843 [Geosiphon pyriformis]|nr:hypothetical protein G9A89_008843 [Geosiphon pyriformis]
MSSQTITNTQNTMASVEDIKRQLEVATTEYRRCVEELNEKGEKLKEKEEKLKKLMEGEKEDELREKEDELREKEDELRELKKNLRQEKYKNENEKHWWIEDMQELEKQKEKLEKQKEKLEKQNEKQNEKLEEEVKELKVDKNELKVEKNEWKMQMQKLQNTLMEATKTGNSGVGKWSRIKKYFLIHPITIILPLNLSFTLHLRYLSSIPVFIYLRERSIYSYDDRHKLLAFYPSEPILAEAAALLMKDQNVLRKLLHFLLDALHTGYIEPGYRGELVARLLLMIAWDHATRDRDISPHLGNLGYSKEFVSRPIRVKEFLISLFGQENYDEHIQSFPQKLADGLLAFTHFIPVTYTPNQTQLRTLFIRFAAVICKRNQAGVDLIIPVLLDWDGSSPISVDSMSYFLIQVKNWSKVYDYFETAFVCMA